jgi:hypothetical protein
VQVIHMHAGEVLLAIDVLSLGGKNTHDLI